MRQGWVVVTETTYIATLLDGLGPIVTRRYYRWRWSAELAVFLATTFCMPFYQIVRRRIERVA